MTEEAKKAPSSGALPAAEQKALFGEGNVSDKFKDGGPDQAISKSKTETGASGNSHDGRRKLPYVFGVASETEGARLLEFADARDDGSSFFLRHLMQIAAISLGEGLQETPKPVIGLALRSTDITPLLALAHIVTTNDAKPVHTVEFNGELVAGNSPALLAEALSQEHGLGLLEGDIIVLLVRDAMRTKAWETATLCNSDPLTRFLTSVGKQLIVGFETAGSHALSRVVNADNRIMPMPWAMPIVAAAARLCDFSPERIDPRLLSRFEHETRWQGPEDDKAERGRFQQLAEVLKTVAGPAEFEARLGQLLDDQDFDIDNRWRKRRLLVDEAFRLIAPGNGGASDQHFPRGPAMIRQALLFTTAFCDKLPGRRFLEIARASLEPQARVEFAELLDHEREALREMAGFSGTDKPQPPELSLMTDYFDRHADRLCREYDIGREKGDYITLQSGWADFALAAHIGLNAPVAAATFVRRLLSNIDLLELSEFVGSGALIDILASTKYHLAASFDDRLLISWLAEHTFRPLLSQIIETQALSQLATELQRSGSNSGALLAEGLHANNNAKIALAAGWQMAETTTLFLSAYHRIAESQGDRRNMLDEGNFLKAILDAERWPGNFEAAFCLGSILMDPRKPNAVDRRNTYGRIRSFVWEQDRDLMFFRRVVAKYLNLSSGVLDVPFGPFDQAERILDFLIDARRDMHVAWRHVQDVTTEHILNFDIRWPPDNGSLLSYEAMATELLTGHVMDLSGEDADTPQAVAVRDYLLRNFFSVAPSSWLERSWGRLAAREGGSRLRDCLNILLDGVPAQATIWRSEDKRQQTKELLHCLCSICNTPRLDDPDDIETGLAGIVSYAEPSPAEEALIRLYGLFWPAVLVHWRCQLFGVAPIQPGSPAAGVLRTFLSRLRDEVPTACLASLRHGLDALAQACEDALVIGADAVGDRRAAEFYAAKARAIRKISGFFQPAAKTKAR